MNAVDDDAIRAAGRVCFFAHYHPYGLVAEHVLIYLAALRDAGFAVVVLSTATMVSGERDKLAAACAMLVERDNHGLDFGGWIEACRRFFPLSAEYLLLANDSVYAPFGDLAAFIDRLTATPADFYGAVESHEAGAHLQSWFLLLRPAAYGSEAFQRLMRDSIPPEMSKHDIIMKYEIGLTAELVAAGLRCHAAYTPRAGGLIATERPFNPGHLLWRQLIEDEHIPFLKIELLRNDPMHVSDIEEWPAVAERYGPALGRAIAEDLSIRRSFEDHGMTERLRWSLDVYNTVYWPEVHGFVKRDHRHRNATARRANRYGFLALIYVGRYWRAVARRMRKPGSARNTGL